MPGKFQIFQGKDGQDYFRLKAGNGETILSSEGYKSKASCDNGIASVRKNCVDENCFEKKETASGNFRFNLKSTNGQVIGSSQNYKSESGRNNGIKSVAKNAPDAKVVEVD